MNTIRTRVVKKARTPAQVAVLRERIERRAASRMPLHELRFARLKELDSQARALQQTLTYFIKKGTTASLASVAAETVSGVKERFGGTLGFLITEAPRFGFDEVQVRGLREFKKRIDDATDAQSMHNALGYFDSRSCILKLPRTDSAKLFPLRKQSTPK